MICGKGSKKVECLKFEFENGTWEKAGQTSKKFTSATKQTNVVYEDGLVICSGSKCEAIPLEKGATGPKVDFEVYDDFFTLINDTHYFTANTEDEEYAIVNIETQEITALPPFPDKNYEKTRQDYAFGKLHMGDRLVIWVVSG